MLIFTLLGSYFLPLRNVFFFFKYNERVGTSIPSAPSSSSSPPFLTCSPPSKLLTHPLPPKRKYKIIYFTAYTNNPTLTNLDSPLTPKTSPPQHRSQKAHRRRYIFLHRSGEHPSERLAPFGIMGAQS